MPHRPSLPDALRVLVRHRTDQVVVTTMAATREWRPLAEHPLDFHYVPSSMGQATSIALGLALARPDKRVVCVNGDGSQLMNLGSLVTITAAGVKNLSLVVLDNGVYEVTGGQRTPAAAARNAVDFPALAKAAGFPQAWECGTLEEWEAAVPPLLTADANAFACVAVEPIPGGLPAVPPGSHVDRAAAFKAALAER